MSGTDRGDRGALAALGIVVAAIVFVTALGWLSNPANQAVGQPASDYVKANQNGDVAQSVASSNNFNPWLDSYAQWVMAALSVVATGVSIWAVLFLRGTLRETQETNRIQNESLRWQRRALSATEGAVLGITKLGVQFDKAKTAFAFFVTIKNTGKSPAFIQHFWHAEAVGKKLPQDPTFGTVGGVSGPIFPNRSMEVEFGRTPIDKPIVNQKLFDAVNGGQITYYCCCKIEYADMFGTVFDWGFVTLIESEKVGDDGVRFRLVETTDPSDLTYLREKQEDKAKT